MKRFLLLGAALASFGAMMVSGAFSFGTFTDTDTDTNVAVIASADNATVSLTGHVSPIAADNLHHKVDDISVTDVDANYQYNLTKLEVTDNGSVAAGTCGTHDYQLNDGGTQADTITGAPIVTVNDSTVDTMVDLELSILTSGTNTACEISGGIVTATFEAAGF